MADSLHAELMPDGVAVMPTYRELIRMLRELLVPERSYFWLALVYGIVISLLMLSVPVAVQALIGTVANTGLPSQVVILAVLLFVALGFAAVLILLRHYLMERLKRGLYVRLTEWMVERILDDERRELSPSAETRLLHRYFDIMTLKTHLPEILVGGIMLALQTLTGAVVVSLYHPYLMFFSLGLMFLIWLTWRVWGRRATQSSVQLSHAKYGTASFLQAMARRSRAGEPAGELQSDADASIAAYIRAHAHHFGHHFSQFAMLIALYVLANALLLGVGGYLVIIGQLSLGQLVGAELIMSVILLGVSQLSYYLDKFYDMVAATEELSLFEFLRQQPGAKDV